jgi:hypothetical protein
VPAAGAACPGVAVGVGAGAVARRGGGAASWSSKAAMAARAYWASSSAVGTHG